MKPPAAQCTNNLKQIALATMNYESSNQTLPINTTTSPSFSAGYVYPGKLAVELFWGTGADREFHRAATALQCHEFQLMPLYMGQ